MFKCIHGLAPHYLSNDVTMHVDIHGYDTRSAENRDLYIPRIRCTKGIYKRSILYKGSSLWNKLPPWVKESTSLNEFKHNFRFLNGWIHPECIVLFICTPILYPTLMLLLYYYFINFAYKKYPPPPLFICTPILYPTLMLLLYYYFINFAYKKYPPPPPPPPPPRFSPFQSICATPKFKPGSAPGTRLVTSHYVNQGSSRWMMFTCVTRPQ